MPFGMFCRQSDDCLYQQALDIVIVYKTQQFRHDSRHGTDHGASQLEVEACSAASSAANSATVPPLLYTYIAN